MASERRVWIWLREDSPPKVLERGKRPSGPGRVFEVLNPSSREAAEKLVEDALKSPSIDDGAQWLATEQAKRRVTEIDVEQWIKAKEAEDARFSASSVTTSTTPTLTTPKAQE